MFCHDSGTRFPSGMFSTITTFLERISTSRDLERKITAEKKESESREKQDRVGGDLLLLPRVSSFFPSLSFVSFY